MKFLNEDLVEYDELFTANFTQDSKIREIWDHFKRIPNEDDLDELEVLLRHEPISWNTWVKFWVPKLRELRRWYARRTMIAGALNSK